MEQRSIDGAVRQNKAFKQRLTYWKGKGYSADEAYRRACATTRLLALVPQPADQVSYRRESADGRKPDETKTCSTLMNPPGDGFQDGRGPAVPVFQAQSPTPPAVFTASDQLKTGLCPLSAEIRLPEASSLTADAVHLVVCSVVVLGASALLVRSSAVVFGSSWDGWLKAGLLELGILGLSVYRPSTLLELLVSRGGAVVLAALSLYVLHAGVRDAAAHEITTAESSSAEVAELQDERAQLVRVLSALPEQHLTRRQGLLQQLAENSSRLQTARERASRSETTQTIERHYDVEAFARLALMFLNVCFAHGLTARFTSRKRSSLGSLDLRVRREALGT